MDFPLKTIHFGYPHLWQNPHMNLIEFRHYLHRILVFTSYTTGFALHAWWAWGHLPCRESPPCCLMCIPVGGLWFIHHIYIYISHLYTIPGWVIHHISLEDTPITKWNDVISSADSVGVWNTTVKAKLSSNTQPHTQWVRSSHRKSSEHLLNWPLLSLDLHWISIGWQVHWLLAIFPSPLLHRRPNIAGEDSWRRSRPPGDIGEPGPESWRTKRQWEVRKTGLMWRYGGFLSHGGTPKSFLD